MRSFPYGLLAFTVCVGCTSLLPGDEPSADAGSPVDAGPRADAGPGGADSGLDAGVERDGGMDVDGGSPSDAGRELDAGPDGGAGCPSVPSVTFEHVVAGSSGSCAWNSSDLYCWGDNSGRQILDDSTNTSFRAPQRVVTAGNIRDVCIGESFICWARGQTITCRGTLPDGEPSDTTLSHDQPIDHLSCGAEHICFLDTDQELHCYGDNRHGQADGMAGDLVEPPGHLNGEVARVTAGDQHTCYTREMEITSGEWEVETFCFGNGLSFGSTGTVEVEEAHPRSGGEPVSGPQDVCLASPLENPNQIVCNTLTASFATVGSVGVGLGFFCAIAAAGANAPTEVHCTGANDDGRLGRTPTATVTPPWPRPACEEYREISSGARHTCVLTNTQRVLCFGVNDAGQLGRTTPTDWGPMAPINL